MSTLTWLHPSDLHFGQKQEYDGRIVRDALLRDIRERVEQDGLRPDFVVVSGDIAFSGKPEEYQMARPFFDNLLAATLLESGFPATTCLPPRGHAACPLAT